MAKPIQYTPEPARIGPDAHEELERLLQSAHEHGVLRFANDLIAANTRWSQFLVDGLSSDGARNAVQNLAVLGMLLSRIEPDDLYKVAFACRDALLRLQASASDGEGNGEAPGLRGAYRMLHDDALWSAVAPLLEALKVFAARLNRDIDKPIVDFTADKPRNAGER